MRPSAIVNFERLFIASVAAAVLLLFLEGSEANNFFGSGAMLIVRVVGVALTLGLALLASRKRNSIARWLLAALTLLGLVVTVRWLSQMLSDNVAFDLVDVVTLVAVVFQTVAVAFLFTSPARTWFGKNQAVEAAD